MKKEIQTSCIRGNGSTLSGFDRAWPISAFGFGACAGRFPLDQSRMTLNAGDHSPLCSLFLIHKPLAMIVILLLVTEQAGQPI